MGEVVIKARVMPKDPESLDKVKEALNKREPASLEVSPIGFGLSALIVVFVIPDEGGQQDRLENELSAIDGVGDVEIISASRGL